MERPRTPDGCVEMQFKVLVQTMDAEEPTAVTQRDVAYAVAQQFGRKHVQQVIVIDLHTQEVSSAVPE